MTTNLHDKMLARHEVLLWLRSNSAGEEHMKTVIEMAREAGGDWDSISLTDKEFLTRFAALVRADERKKWEEQTAVEIHEAILESKEAMKLALDALEKLVRFESDSWEIGSCRIAGQATRALREALAEQPARSNT